MDNGHHNAIYSSNPDVDDNLNEENWQRSLEISAPTDMPSPEKMKARANAIFSSENTVGNFPEELENTPFENTPSNHTGPLDPVEPIRSLPKDQPALGKITDISAPIRSELEHTYNPANIKTTGDRLDPASILEVDHAISELNHTGDLNKFYDKARTMTDANTLNSFNRKLYNEGEAA